MDVQESELCVDFNSFEFVLHRGHRKPSVTEVLGDRILDVDTATTRTKAWNHGKVEQPSLGKTQRNGSKFQGLTSKTSNFGSFLPMLIARDGRPTETHC